MVVLRAARDDGRRAAEVLDDGGKNPGIDFEDELEEVLHRISEMPRLYSPAEDSPEDRECREYYIERFQYRVIYLIQDETIHVPAVVYATRTPGSWRRRLDDA